MGLGARLLQLDRVAEHCRSCCWVDISKRAALGIASHRGLVGGDCGLQGVTGRLEGSVSERLRGEAHGASLCTGSWPRAPPARGSCSPLCDRPSPLRSIREFSLGRDLGLTAHRVARVVSASI